MMTSCSHVMHTKSCIFLRATDARILAKTRARDIADQSHNITVSDKFLKAFLYTLLFSKCCSLHLFHTLPSSNYQPDNFVKIIVRGFISHTSNLLGIRSRAFTTVLLRHLHIVWISFVTSSSN